MRMADNSMNIQRLSKGSTEEFGGVEQLFGVLFQEERRDNKGLRLELKNQGFPPMELQKAVARSASLALTTVERWISRARSRTRRRQGAGMRWMSRIKNPH